MPPKLISDNDLLGQLRSAFRAEGYEGASISHLQQASGLGRSSLYHRFPNGKHDMAVAVLQDTMTHFVEVIFGSSQPESTPTEQINAVGHHLREFYQNGELPCLLETLSLGTPSDEVAGLICTGMQALIAALSAIAQQSGYAVQVADERATDAAAAIEGALVVARTINSPTVFDRTIDSLPDRLILRTP